jgi:hypothetical protein
MRFAERLRAWVWECDYFSQTRRAARAFARMSAKAPEYRRYLTIWERQVARDKRRRFILKWKRDLITGKWT